MALVFTLIKADGWGWGSGQTLAGFAIAAALIAAFLVIERRHVDPLVPLGIFKNRSLAASDAAMLLLAAGLFGMFFFCTLYLQQVLGYSALETGLLYLPFSAMLIGGSGIASRLVDRFTPKPVLVPGLFASTVGFLLLTRVSGDSDYASHVLPAILVLGAGLGLSFVPITIAATNGVPASEAGLASGLLNVTQQVGGALGLAILSSVSTSRVTSALDGGSALPAALTHGFKGAFIVGAVFCALAAVMALALLPSRRREPEKEEAETIALSFARCPGAPYCGHLARLVTFGRRIRRRPAAQG
jgi:predicted MFS family arabinose efflux permease